jgi:hypothetical protein
MYEHTTRLSINTESHANILTINQKERKRPDPTNLTSEKSNTNQHFDDLGPCFVDYFGDPIETICISTHECGGFTVIISNAGGLHGLVMDKPHEGTPSHKF